VRWSRNPGAVLADTRRAVLARPIQFSKNRPNPYGSGCSGAPSPPPDGAPCCPVVTELGGTFLSYYSTLSLSTPLSAPSRFGNSSRQRGGAVEVSDLGAREPGAWGHPPLPFGRAFDERRRRNLILRGRGFIVNPFRPPRVRAPSQSLAPHARQPRLLATHPTRRNQLRQPRAGDVLDDLRKLDK
jgi:hypothetical protein